MIKKKWLSILLVVAMIVTMIPITAFAEGDEVCCIGEKNYTSLQEAVSDAKTSDTIILLKDTPGNMMVPTGSDITLNLNGHTLSQSESTEPTPYAINNEGTLKITDSGETKGKIVNSLSATTSCVRNNGNLTMEGVTVESTFVAVKNEPSAELTVNDCKFYSTFSGSGTGALLNWGEATVSNTVIDAGSGTSAVYVNSEGSQPHITLTNCDLAGKYALSSRNDGKVGTTVEIEGGSISSTGTTAVNPSDSDMKISGNIKVNGNAVNSVLKYSETGTNVILDENASTKSNTTIPEGVTLTIPEDVTYTVGSSHALTANGTLENQGTLVSSAYNQTNKSYYSTLARAMDQSKGESTILLLTDVVENVTIKPDKTITLDLNNHNLTGSSTEAGEVAIKNSGNLTIKDSGTDGMIRGEIVVEKNPKSEIIPAVSIEGGSFDISNWNVADDGSKLEVKSGTFNYGDGDILNYISDTATTGEVKVNLPKDAVVEITSPNAEKVIFDAPAGTTIKNESGVAIKVDTPNGNVSVGNGSEITAKPYEPPYIPPVDSLAVAKASAKTDISKYLDIAKYDTAEQAVIKEIVERAKADIEKATSQASIDAVVAVAKAELDAVLTTAEKEEQAVEAEKIARIKSGVKDTTIKLKSSIVNGKIKLNWTKSAGYKVDYYEVYRSTKRFEGYGTKPFFETKKGGMTGSYKNTAIKKGSRYYYKVRGVREIAGETVYTQDSNKAWRMVK